MTTTFEQPALSAADDYMDLVRAFPLRVLKGGDEQAAAVRVYARLGGRAAPPLTVGERAYVQALARFIQDYDQRSFAAKPRRGTPLVRLRYVLSESGTTPSRLAILLDASPSTVSHILAGRRNLTLDQVRRLSKHFKLDAGYFI